MPRWRNGSAHRPTKSGVAGSSPAWGAIFQHSSARSPTGRRQRIANPTIDREFESRPRLHFSFQLCMDSTKEVPHASAVCPRRAGGSSGSTHSVGAPLTRRAPIARPDRARMVASSTAAAPSRRAAPGRTRSSDRRMVRRQRSPQRISRCPWRSRSARRVVTPKVAGSIPAGHPCHGLLPLGRPMAKGSQQRTSRSGGAWGPLLPLGRPKAKGGPLWGQRTSRSGGAWGPHFLARLAQQARAPGS